MGQKSFYSYRVEPQDVDFTLRATLPALGVSILNVAGADAHGKGFGVDALNADNHSWVLSRMAIEVDERPQQYTDYTVATWINEYGRVLSTRNFTLSDASGHEFARAVTQWAMIDLTTRTAVDLSWVGRAHNEAIVDAPSPAEKPRKIRSVEPERFVEHRVVYSDIDFNRHVNTMRYIEMCLDMLPVECFARDGGCGSTSTSCTSAATASCSAWGARRARGRRSSKSATRRARRPCGQPFPGANRSTSRYKGTDANRGADQSAGGARTGCELRRGWGTDGAQG